jgi:hypothetical protein
MVQSGKNWRSHDRSAPLEILGGRSRAHETLAGDRCPAGFRSRLCPLMGWSGRAPAPPASEAGKGRQRSRHSRHPGVSSSPRLCSLIPGYGVKLSAIILAGPTVLSAVGACPPHDGVRRRWWINVASAVSLIESSQKIGRSHHRQPPGRDIFPALLREPFELWLVTQQPPSSTS